MNELESLRKDFIGLIESINTNIEKEFVIKQLKAITENYFDYLNEKLGS